MFPCLTIEQVRLLLREANGNVNDTAEMAFDLLNDTPSTSSSSPLEQSIIREAIRNGAMSESCSNGKHSMAMGRK
ncbi:hypothetical protein LOAG_09861 [Loa loa]|nr:hypothetical protein LOAG_09861 [Loa loa]EFO18636.1 hypothetical protein LOAG_09861 [Loa loa]